MWVLEGQWAEKGQDLGTFLRSTPCGVVKAGDIRTLDNGLGRTAGGWVWGQDKLCKSEPKGLEERGEEADSRQEGQLQPWHLCRDMMQGNLQQQGWRSKQWQMERPSKGRVEWSILITNVLLGLWSYHQRHMDCVTTLKLIPLFLSVPGLETSR